MTFISGLCFFKPLDRPVIVPPVLTCHYSLDLSHHSVSRFPPLFRARVQEDCPVGVLIEDVGVGNFFL